MGVNQGWAFLAVLKKFFDGMVTLKVLLKKHRGKDTYYTTID